MPQETSEAVKNLCPRCGKPYAYTLRKPRGNRYYIYAVHVDFAPGKRGTRKLYSQCYIGPEDGYVYVEKIHSVGLTNAVDQDYLMLARVAVFKYLELADEREEKGGSLGEVSRMYREAEETLQELLDLVRKRWASLNIDKRLAIKAVADALKKLGECVEYIEIHVASKVDQDIAVARHGEYLELVSGETAVAKAKACTSEKIGVDPSLALDIAKNAPDDDVMRAEKLVLCIQCSPPDSGRAKPVYAGEKVVGYIEF